MLCAWCFGSLLFASAVLADYYIDNTNVSLTYSAQPGSFWQTYSASTSWLELGFQNATGNFTIVLDSSDCYDQNYAQIWCITSSNCQVAVPFTGSGISMYVFNAGLTGIAATFAVDGGPPVTNQTDTPPISVNYQQSRVLIYDIQGLPSGNHTMLMSVVDWQGAGTSMKFDYAYVNETFVPTPTSSTTLMSSFTLAFASTSRLPSSSQTSSSSSPPKSVNLGAVIGGTLGGVGFLIALVIGVLYYRNHKAMRQGSGPETPYQPTPFMSEHPSTGSRPVAPTAIPAFAESSKTLFTSQANPNTVVPPHVRATMLRDALAGGAYSGPEPSITSETTRTTNSMVLQPLRHRPSIGADGEIGRGSFHFADSGSPFSDLAMVPPYNLTAEQIETIERLRADGVPQETISRVIEGFATPRSSAMDSSGDFVRAMSVSSVIPPPSYQTRIR